MNQLKFLAVILARGKSEGLPNKNILDLCGKPVIVYSIEAAIQSKYVDRVIVTTDSQEIADISRDFGAEVPFLRPNYLAQDTTHSPEVIIHAVEYLKEKEGYFPDYTITLQPTSPLRKASHIDEGIKIINKTDSECVVSIKEADYPPYWLLKKVGQEYVSFINDGTDYRRLERQELPKAYRTNGAVYITKTDILCKTKQIILEKMRGFVMEDKYSFDIDDIYDFKMIEFIMKEGLKSN